MSILSALRARLTAVRGGPWRALLSGALALATIGSCLAPLVPPAAAIVSTTITIDGLFADWVGVRCDPQNASRDTQIQDPDPDYPGQPDRDVYVVNATWDSRYLYLAYRRTAGGTKAITFGAYLDLNGDGLLQDSDRCVLWTVAQSKTGRYADAHASSPTARILSYHQATLGVDGAFLHPEGDPMGHDGETPDGWCEVQSGNIVPTEPMDGYLSEDGVEFEGRVAWDDLGVEAGSPISIHFVDANGESWGKPGVPSTTRKWIGQPPQYLEENRGQIEDNVDDIWWLRRLGVTVSPDRLGSGAPGATVVYLHSVTNSSNTTQTFDLTSSSSSGWQRTITTTGGVPVTSVTLAPGGSTTVELRCVIPTGTPDDVVDTESLTATSRVDPTVRSTATDQTKSARVAVTVVPDGYGSIAPGQTMTYTFVVQNNMGTDGVFSLATTGTLGFPTTIRPAGGLPPLSSVSLRAGESTQVVVDISFPATAAVGLQDVTRLTATLLGDATVHSSAKGTTDVLPPLTITPDRTSYAGIGTIVSYAHTITNSWPSSRTVTLSYTDSHAWPVSFYAADGVTRITTVTVGPYGGAVSIIARVSVPGTASSPTTDTATIRATAGTSTASVTDTTVVRRLATYADDACTVAATAFRLTDVVYAGASGLASNQNVCFVWRDPSGAIVRESPVRPIDAQGMAFDAYPSVVADRTGTWMVELHLNGPGGTLLQTTEYAMSYKAEITGLSASDAARIGDTVSISSSVRNDVGREITSSAMSYLVWWDGNGDGVYGAGDTWIDATGTPHPYSAGSTPASHVTAIASVAATGTWSEPAPWQLASTRFPNQGTYNVTATWRSSDGSVIDEKTGRFFAVPALGWPLAVLLALLFGGLVWRRGLGGPEVRFAREGAV